ncbi:hypothetical protein OIDMADRAFT_185117 [Oidiodendron maius Zn]|uniref:Uncharacterized protein n=1 Tax=Oidiodendron maius (strain Zn) TaxID=913774 RepID=A0A0C3G8K6_OIDMZ|nr:hypothetical protein OIDMADRAFT_185117 [Oidiodendron maius Zn]
MADNIDQALNELRAAMAKVMALDPTGATVFAIAHETVFYPKEQAPAPSAAPSTKAPIKGQGADVTPRTKEWFASQGRKITPKSRFEYDLYRTPEWALTPSVKRARPSSATEDPASTPSTKRSRRTKLPKRQAGDEGPDFKGEEPYTSDLEDEDEDDVPQYEFWTRS